MGTFKRLELSQREGMNRGEILDTAKLLTYGDRQRKAGDFKTNHDNIAKIWSVILGTKIEAYQDVFVKFLLVYHASNRLPS